jgi:hypothetical protein
VAGQRAPVRVLLLQALDELVHDRDLGPALLRAELPGHESDRPLVEELA